MKGSRKDGEREVEHGPYTLELQLSYGTTTVIPKEWKFFFSFLLQSRYFNEPFLVAEKPHFGTKCNFDRNYLN